MILKRCVLSRIQNFQQCRGRIAMEARAELINFIQHEDGIFGAGFADALDDISRKSAHIGAPVPADLRLIMDAAKTLPDEFPVHGPCDALTEGSLADARRTH